MLSGRFTNAVVDRKSVSRKSGGARFWTVLWTVTAVVGATVVVPALIALGTGAWIAKPDAQASAPAPEIERANANDRPSIGAVPRRTASHRSVDPETGGRFAESSGPRRLALGSEPQASVPDPSTFAPVAAEEALA